MEKDKNILFLTLKIFSATGGIEKVCKMASLALHQLTSTSPKSRLKVLSMYDCTADVDPKYISANLFTGFNKKKLKYIYHAVKSGLVADIVLVSHINLLSVGYLIKKLHPKTKLVLYAHGIEVWGPLSTFRQKMLHNCDRILSVSGFTKQLMLQKYKLKNEQVEIVNNCLDPFLPPAEKNKDAALQKKYGFIDSDIILITLTRISSKELYKGYDHVLIAIHQLKNRFPNLKYLIVGRYDDEEKKRIDSIIRQYSLEGYVVFAGYVNDEALAKHYGLGDIYVMPSKKEGFGIVFIEAMHYGLPVIAGNKDGSVDALCNGKLGMLVDPDNQTEITNAIEKVILNRQQYIPDSNQLESAFSFTNYKNKLSELLNRF